MAGKAARGTRAVSPCPGQFQTVLSDRLKDRQAFNCSRGHFYKRPSCLNNEPVIHRAIHCTFPFTGSRIRTCMFSRCSSTELTGAEPVRESNPRPTSRDKMRSGKQHIAVYRQRHYEAIQKLASGLRLILILSRW